MLRMWNMSKGRSQYKTKIPLGTEAVLFSPDAAMYALLSGKKVCSSICQPKAALLLIGLEIEFRLAERLAAACVAAVQCVCLTDIAAQTDCTCRTCHTDW
jgi:hypothetical protein